MKKGTGIDLFVGKLVRFKFPQLFDCFDKISDTVTDINNDTGGYYLNYYFSMKKETSINQQVCLHVDLTPNHDEILFDYGYVHGKRFDNYLKFLEYVSKNFLNK